MADTLLELRGPGASLSSDMIYCSWSTTGDKVGPSLIGETCLSSSCDSGVEESSAGGLHSLFLHTTDSFSLLALQQISKGYSNCSGHWSVVACSPLVATLNSAPLQCPSLPVISFVILATFQNPLGVSES